MGGVVRNFDRMRATARAYGRERYAFYKTHGICVRCGQADAEPGRIYCTACRLYHNQLRSGAQIK